MSKLLVYSCVTGGYDDVYAGILASTGVESPDVRYVLYTDQLAQNTTPKQFKLKESAISWELRPLIWSHPLCKIRTSRWHKANSHLLPDDVDHVLWLDGTQRIKNISLPNQLKTPLQTVCELAAFKHPDRICVYQELMACRKWKKDNFELMQRQLEEYKAEGYPAYNGLVETTCVFRAHRSSKITAFNRLWWQQMDQHSFRDQLSFNYAAWKLSLPFGIIPGSRTNSPFFDYVHHKHG